jgi:signal peptide peptidase SppA
VGTILLDIDSPGGSVAGLAEVAAEILAARDSRKVIAVADSLAASAAYWLGSQASEFIVTPSGQVGSIGIITTHEDVSGMMESAGVKITAITAGKYKGEGSPFAPLNEEAIAALQKRVDDYYGMFVNAVAKGRNVTAEAVRSGFGEGRVVGAKEAVKLGMADRVATIDNVLSKLGVATNTRAESEPAIVDTELRTRRLALLSK